MTAWMDAAACLRVDPEVFFPHDGQPADDAKAVCATCPVALECLTYALDKNYRVGVWGGKTPRTRKDMHAARSRSTYS